MHSPTLRPIPHLANNLGEKLGAPKLHMRLHRRPPNERAKHLRRPFFALFSPQIRVLVLLYAPPPSNALDLFPKLKPQLHKLVVIALERLVGVRGLEIQRYALGDGGRRSGGEVLRGLGLDLEVVYGDLACESGCELLHEWAVDGPFLEVFVVLEALPLYRPMAISTYAPRLTARGCGLTN